MALSLPYPGQPALNSALASTPVSANITAIAQAIQSFDASQIAAGTLTASAFATAINPNTILHDTITPFVQSGCVWSAVSGLIGTMTGGTIYVGTSSAFFRTVVNGVGSQTFTASKDTYIDIDYNGNIYYSAVSNSAASPSLTANALRVAKVVTSGSAITSVVQTGWDSLGNPIYNVTPRPIVIGLASITTNFTTSGTNTAVTGLSSTVILPANRNVRVSAFSFEIFNSNSASNTDMTLWDGTVGSGTQISTSRVTSGGVNYGAPAAITAIVANTSAGTKTYNVGLSNIGGGTANLSAMATAPAFILVELL